jgi:uncharacterized protein YndB with AHSA1/START domain
MAKTSSGETIMTLPSDREIVVTRVFDAPRALVFKAYTDPDAIPHWWGPAKYKTTVDKMDLRVGGAWRYVHVGPEGDSYGFHGEYREIVPPERLVSTFEFEGMPGHVSEDTLTLEERDGKTYMTTTTRFASREDRDGMLQSGMEEGMRETMDRLAQYVSKH